jgi:hypothetical protein
LLPSGASSSSSSSIAMSVALHCMLEHQAILPTYERRNSIHSILLILKIP